MLCKEGLCSMYALQDDVQKFPCLDETLVFYNVGMLNGCENTITDEKDASLTLRFLRRSISDYWTRKLLGALAKLHGLAG